MDGMTQMADSSQAEDDITEGIRGFLAQESPDAFVVERVLKESPAEVTQLVRRASGEPRAYVRKLIDPTSGLGGAYFALERAGRAGVTLAHVPRVLSCGREEGRLVVVMDYACGRSLRELVGTTSPDERARLAAVVFPQLCEAVRELHELPGGPVIHRDVTPSNIVVGEEGSEPFAWLVDFGIARRYKQGSEADTTHFGTRAYAPPEQFGFGQTDVRTDVYALGLTLYFMLTGSDPTPEDRRRSFTSPHIREPLRAVIARAAELDPSARFSGARALTRAFAEALPLVGLAPASVAPAAPAGPVRPVAVTEAPTLVPPACRQDPPLVSRIAGACWNALVTCTSLIVAFGCVQAALHPAGGMEHAPAWLLFVVYVVDMAPSALALGYVLLDKRGMRRRHPRLAARSAFRDALTIMLLVAVGFVVSVLLVSAFGNVPSLA